MPKDYSKSKIYIIRSYETDEVYIGSTIEPLNKRISQHRASFKRFMNNKGHYYTSFKLIEHADHYIELYEVYPCENKEQLNKREGEIIRNTCNCVNKYIAGNMVGKTEQEYNKERYAKNVEYHKERYAKNADKLKEYQKEWNSKNADKLKEYQKEWNAKNADKLKEYSKERYAKNADVIKAKYKTKLLRIAVIQELEEYFNNY